MRTSADTSRVAIRNAATEIFCDRGYKASTLEEIGAQVGITRGAVLHHFHSKADLLAAVADPYLRALSDLLTNTHVGDPPTPDQQRQVITDLTDLFLKNRGAVRLLVNDVGARVELGLGDRWDALRTRLIVLLFGHAATSAEEVRAAAALGAVCQPVAGSWLDFSKRETRRELVDVAVRVINPAGATRRAVEAVAQ
jgi:AcrR family transcriptional regulator